MWGSYQIETGPIIDFAVQFFNVFGPQIIAFSGGVALFGALVFTILAAIQRWKYI